VVDHPEAEQPRDVIGRAGRHAAEMRILVAPGKGTDATLRPFMKDIGKLVRLAPSRPDRVMAAPNPSTIAGGDVDLEGQQRIGSHHCRRDSRSSCVSWVAKPR